MKKEAVFIPIMNGMRAYWPLGVAGSASVVGNVKKGFVLFAVDTICSDSSMWDNKYNSKPNPYKLYNPY